MYVHESPPFDALNQWYICLQKCSPSELINLELNIILNYRVLAIWQLDNPPRNKKNYHGSNVTYLLLSPHTHIKRGLSHSLTPHKADRNHEKLNELNQTAIYAGLLQLV